MRSIACAALAAFAIVPLAAAQAQTVYVSNERGNSITVIDGATASPSPHGRWASGRAASP
jgi:hypothetical protein